MNISSIETDLTPPVDLVVHVNQELDEEHRELVKKILTAQQGVCDVQFATNRNHLMVVGYDPMKINSSGILDLVQQQSMEAQLVGGL